MKYNLKIKLLQETVEYNNMKSKDVRRKIQDILQNIYNIDKKITRHIIFNLARPDQRKVSPFLTSIFTLERIVNV